MVIQKTWNNVDVPINTTTENLPNSWNFQAPNKTFLNRANTSCNMQTVGKNL